jgi:hypothetical protein
MASMPLATISQYNSTRIAVGVGEIDAARHVVFDRGLDRHAERLEFSVGRLQFLNASELPCHVVQARLCGTGRTPATIFHGAVATAQ